MDLVINIGKFGYYITFLEMFKNHSVLLLLCNAWEPCCEGGKCCSVQLSMFIFFFPNDLHLVKIFLRNTEFKITWLSPN